MERFTAEPLHLDQEGAPLGVRTQKQAPRFTIVLLVSFEELLNDETQPFFFSIKVWWILVQSW